MALTNNEKIGRGFDALLHGIEPWVDMRMSAQAPSSVDWVRQVESDDAVKFGTSRQQSRDDVRFLLRMVTERWRTFDKDLSRAEQALASELRETANRLHHGERFSSNDTYRALDTIERLLTAIGATEEAQAAARLRDEHQRQVFEKLTHNKLREVAAIKAPGVVAGTAIKPWREVVKPHPDVVRGQFSASEFAADLFAVANHQSTAPEYANPREFFARTYLTSGLTDLLSRAAKRLAGDAGASPVVNLQTQFGGGKTHSELALYHLFSGIDQDSLPQAVQDVVAEALPDGSRLTDLDVARVALVGTRLSPSEPLRKPDGTSVRTLWGELAWQLGGREAYEQVANADATGTNPGDALGDVIRAVVAAGRPVLILVDEWVAYSRQLVGRDDLPGGSFAVQQSFAQYLTELAKTTPQVMLVVSIPASDSLDNGGAGSALEVGGPNGQVALEALQQVVGRTADDWRPANSLESFEIVRRRLFEEPDAAALADIAAVAKQYVRFYQENTGFFPKETTSGEYEARIRVAYPIHPELFDRLYEDWSTLPKFQRTRGVLRMMSVVINTLWNSNPPDTSPLIQPGSVPIHDPEVFSEITKYLEDNWKPVIDKDVDGEGATPALIDGERATFGARSVTRRVARTVFMDTVPTLRSAHKGVGMQRLRLGAAVPGDVMNHLADARALLAQKATYLYEDGDRSWYDLAASVTRLAAERAEDYAEADVWAELVRRLGAEARGGKGYFGAVHAAPLDSGDVPDTDTLRLVVVHPKYTWGKDASAATAWAADALQRVGAGQRQRRNMIVFVAADRARYEGLAGAVAEYLAWASIAAEHEQLGLSPQQRDQAKARAAAFDEAVTARIRYTWTAGLVPTEVPGQRPTIELARIPEQGGTLAERVSEKLRATAAITPVLGAATLRLELDRALAARWDRGHISVGELWNWHTQYPYLKRLTTRSVLDNAVRSAADVLLWQQDAFAIADSFDEATGRYLGLWIHGDLPDPTLTTDATVLVRPDAAMTQRREDEARALAEIGQWTDHRPSEAGITSPHSLPVNAGASGPAEPSARPAPPCKPLPRRFFGVKELNPQRYGRDFANLEQEVLAHLANIDGVELEVRIEIAATVAAGFPENAVRTITQNASDLNLEAGFEST